MRFSSLRGEVVELPGGVTVVNDCYNANPMSMRAALEHLAGSDAVRRVAVLGAMAELGAGSAGFHREIGAHASALGIDVLVPVGEDALALHGRLRRARLTRSPRRRRPGRCWRSSPSRATAC